MNMIKLYYSVFFKTAFAIAEEKDENLSNKIVEILSGFREVVGATLVPEKDKMRKIGNRFFENNDQAIESYLAYQELISHAVKDCGEEDVPHELWELSFPDYE
jgi:hypothetical protein